MGSEIEWQARWQRTDGLGRRALPIARMGLAPSLNPLDVLTAPEVIPVLFEPPLLALGLAGLPTPRPVAEPLVVKVAPIRKESLVTMDTDALLVPMLHWLQTNSEPSKREEYPDRKNTPSEEARRG